MFPLNLKLAKRDSGSRLMEQMVAQVWRSGLTTGSAAGLLGVMSLAVSQPAFSQTAAPASDTAELEEIVVTGSRIVRDGNDAPTPVSVMGEEQLQSFASPSIADAVRTLPTLSGGSSPTTSVSTASTGNSNINALNLRALGENRTLVLIDGQRSVASSLSGLVDVNLIPQDLISRVEVATGGASAVYGSDALSGVVNFVLNKEFTGLKTTAQYGGTTHGDGENFVGGVTYGTAFGEGRGHFTFSGNYRTQDVIATNTRDWNLKGWQFMNNPAYKVTNGVSNGQPQRLLLDQVSCSTCIAGGIVTSGPLRGTAFGAGGIPYKFEFGDLVSNPDMRGGDWKETQIRGTRAGTSLSGGNDTVSLFTRGSWELTDNVNIYAQAAYARDKNENYAFSLEDTGGITIKTGNPFLPASVQQAMIDNNLSTISLGSQHPDLPIVVPTNERQVMRLVLGADGKFGDGWKWDTYYQRGVSKLENVAKGITVNSYVTQAYDAVLDPVTGAIVCRDQSNGCKPYNPMGFGVNTQGAIDFVTGNGEQMWRKQEIQQDVAAFSITGTPFATWAGDVSIATGAEWRLESIGKGSNDPISDRFGWWVGGYPATKGSYNVKEVFLETVVPLARDLPFLQALDLSGAVRATDYSTSGGVETWKLGLNWTPIEDIRFRGTLSRDIRAPNLEELYSKGSGGAPAVTNPWIIDPDTGAPITESITSPRIGNPLLKPEKADGVGAGFVLTPRFLPGFALSVDYWSIDIDGSIGLPTTQDIIDGCYEGQTTFCSAIDFQPGTQNLFVVRRTPFNYTSQVARGVDFEASYVFAASELYSALPGAVQLRALATNYRRNATTTDGVVNDTAGENTSFGPPSWKWTTSVNYNVDTFRTSFSARGISSGVYDNDWIECSSNCPVSTTKNVTVSDNHIPSSVFFDAAFAYGFHIGDVELETFLNVRNLLDRDPPIVAANPGGFAYTIAPANAQLYDVLGRTFTVGFRTTF